MTKQDWEQSLIKTISNLDDYHISNDFRTISFDPLNCLIKCRNENDFEQAINWLLVNHQDLLVELLLIFGMTKAQRQEKVLWLNNDLNGFDLITNSAGIKQILAISGLDQLIINEQIESLSSFLYGIKLCQRSHRRKNIYGSRFAKMIQNLLISQKINFETEVMINKKKWDFVINYGDEQKLLIESSFYHTYGSKPNECGRAYLKEFKALNNPKWRPLWVVDGQGARKIPEHILNEHLEMQTLVNFSGFQALISALFKSDFKNNLK